MAEQEPKQKRGLKGFTFFSGFLDTLIGVAFGLAIIYIIEYAVPHFIDNVDNALTGLVGSIFLIPFMIIFIAVLAIAMILFVVLGIMTIVSSFKSDKRNWNGLVIATIVFDAIACVFSLIFMVGSSGTGFIIFLALAVATFIAIIFKSIDLALIRKRMKAYNEQKKLERQSAEAPNFNVLSDLQKKETASESIEKIEEKSKGIDFSVLKDENKDGGNK